MPAPTKINQTPAGWIRASFGRGRCVCLIDSSLPLARDDQTMKLVTLLSLNPERYWVFVISFNTHDRIGKQYSIRGDLLTGAKGSSFATYQDAEDQYAAWSDKETGKKAKRGLKHLGKDED